MTDEDLKDHATALAEMIRQAAEGPVEPLPEFEGEPKPPDWVISDPSGLYRLAILEDLELVRAGKESISSLTADRLRSHAARVTRE